jgi:hypothetical protein
MVISDIMESFEIIMCKDVTFHGVDCLDNVKEYGFEGCYNDDLNHPDPRPGHRIWIKKVHAEKLFNLFTAPKKEKEITQEEEDGSW